MRRTLLLLAGAILAASAAASDGRASLFGGGDVAIHEAVEGPVRAAGGNVTLDAPVDGNVQMAGGKVTLAPAGVVSGNVSVVGGLVLVEGPVKGKLRAAGGKVRIDGPVTGDASVAAGTLELGPNARIEGKLEYRGDELRQDPAAQVTGGIDREPSRHSWRSERTPLERFLHGWMWSAGLVALAALIAAALPGTSQRLARELREYPWVTPLVGLLALTSIPIAAVLFMVTIIGIPIGLLALIGYAALLLLGYVSVAVVVGGMLLDRVKPGTATSTAWHVGAAVLAMLVLALLVRMPFVGGLVKLSVLVVGVGMIVSAIFRRMHPAEAAPAA